MFPYYIEAAKKLNLSIQKTIIGNSRNIPEMKELKNLEFDLILTDPPYSNMMNRPKTGEAVVSKNNSVNLLFM
jgi:16S rRNA G966 N2-methylase RsmD